MSITCNTASGILGAATALKTRVYPNGEAVVYKAKSFKPEPIPEPFEHDLTSLYSCCMRAYGTVSMLFCMGLAPLGLSPLSNSDKALEPGDDDDSSQKKAPDRKGLNGITSFGARIVRNAAYLIENEGGQNRAVFATCTIPDLTRDRMQIVHENFHRVVELYRLGMRRELKDSGLSGEIVTVSEIQEKRYEKTNIPVLHIHSVFCGRSRTGKWAVSKERHDKIWKNSLLSVLQDDELNVASACNLQKIKRSAEGYIGKYMTKGSQAVKKVVEQGYGEWMPKQWWSCSRSLRRRIDKQTRQPDDLSEWLDGAATTDDKTIWLWSRNVEIEMRSGEKVVIARYGRLSEQQLSQIKAAYPIRT